MQIRYKAERGLHCQVLSNIFGGNCHNGFKRVYFDDPMGGYKCVVCKQKFQPDVKESFKHCGKLAKPIRCWQEYCPDCQEIVDD
jgi:hypothetical protein